MKIADQKSAGQVELTQAEQGVEEHTEFDAAAYAKHIQTLCGWMGLIIALPMMLWLVTACPLFSWLPRPGAAASIIITILVARPH